MSFLYLSLSQNELLAILLTHSLLSCLCILACTNSSFWNSLASPHPHLCIIVYKSYPSSRLSSKAAPLQKYSDVTGWKLSSPPVNSSAKSSPLHPLLSFLYCSCPYLYRCMVTTQPSLLPPLLLGEHCP